ncbi:hypothetical protein [Photobacterium kishitanii]|uniref:hypothetical protein n=1 Tax=Photobacterium kishitanii TaxID=318456 RepID=UPI0027390EEB|nr:hypothetical protein [Photobacterium kishitanii]
MRPFSLLCTLFLTIACSSADVAELNNSANIRYDDHCDKYLTTQSNDYFNDFISMQLQQVKALKVK